jgi:acid phosphatase type 7
MLFKRISLSVVLFAILTTGCTRSCWSSSPTSAPANDQTNANESHLSEPHSFLLSWQQDPTTTMTIDWHTAPDVSPFFQYREKVKGPSTKEWTTVEGQRTPFPYSKALVINRAELLELKPAQKYEFRFTRQNKVYHFRTMPSDLSHPIRFLIGGDVMHRPKWMQRTSAHAAARDPDFAVIGGDLAYADGKQSDVDRWYRYLKIWSETMITANGRVIPHIAAIGNHEVKKGYVQNYGDDYEQTDEFRKRESPYYYALMAFPGQPGYGALDFGGYLSLLLLDSDHTNPVDGEQADWLSQSLGEREGVPHRFPIYHVPAYPSVRNPQGETETRVRETWVPLFEKHSLPLAFENHDHTYKRTHPLKDNEVNPDGTIYMGDGAWGVRTRRLPTWPRRGRWYIDEAKSVRHFIEVNLSVDGINLKVIDENGEMFDELNLEGKTSN